MRQPAQRSKTLISRYRSRAQLWRLVTQETSQNRPNRLRYCAEFEAKHMGKRLSKIYTRTGDDGTTGLGDGSRVAKDSLRVEAYGTADEANSVIGVVLACKSVPENIAKILTEVQHDLFELGGELCIPGYSAIDDPFVDRLEAELDDLNKDLPALENFILPGGGEAAAACHLARTVVRRAERCTISLAA